MENRFPSGIELSIEIIIIINGTRRSILLGSIKVCGLGSTYTEKGRYHRGKCVPVPIENTNKFSKV